MADYKKLSDQLRDIIKSSHVSRYAISKATGIPEGSLRRFIKGEVGLRLETIDSISLLLGIKLTAAKKAKKDK